MVSPSVHTSQSRSDGKNTAKKDRRASRAKQGPANHAHPTPAPIHDEVLTSAGRERMIREAAYFRAEHRGFCPGQELEDWVGAEQEINRSLANI